MHQQSCELLARLERCLRAFFGVGDSFSERGEPGVGGVSTLDAPVPLGEVGFPNFYKCFMLPLCLLRSVK